MHITGIIQSLVENKFIELLQFSSYVTIRQDIYH